MKGRKEGRKGRREERKGRKERKFSPSFSTAHFKSCLVKDYNTKKYIRYVHVCACISLL